MLWIAVVDDEIMTCCTIAGKIKEILKEMKIPCMIRQFCSGQELIQSSDNFDIIFLDIIMRDLDGMKTAQIFRKKSFDRILIFISSSKEYVLEAYDVEAFWYLLKPIDDEKLKKVLQKAIYKIENHAQEFIIINQERQKRKLFLDDIYYFEIRGRIIDIHGIHGIFTYYKQIGILENTLQDKGFFRCHKSYLINLKYVNVYNRQEITLDNGEKIVIAKRRYEEFCILTILSLFAAGFYIFGMNQIYLEQKKSEQYYAQITSYKILEEQYSQSKRLRHDLKNHILALLGLLKNKEWKKMEDYLNTMAYSANLGISEDLTGNKVVDILIYQKRNIAERKHFLWECDMQIPNLYCINEFDLCILFGNIVDNAIEACERLQENSSNNQQPFINIQSKIIKKCFLLKVKNSADTAKKVTSSNKKEAIKKHGIGLLNIHDVVNKYNGIINIETENNVFIISILIPLNKNEYDKK